MDTNYEKISNSSEASLSFVGSTFSEYAFKTIISENNEILKDIKCSIEKINESHNEKVETSDKVHKSLGFELFDGSISTVFHRNSQLLIESVKKMCTMYLSVDKALVPLNIYEGEEPIAVNNRYLGSLVFNDVPKGQQKFDLTFDMNNEGVLRVKAKIVSTRIEKEMRIQVDAEKRDGIKTMDKRVIEINKESNCFHGVIAPDNGLNQNNTKQSDTKVEKNDLNSKELEVIMKLTEKLEQNMNNLKQETHEQINAVKEMKLSERITSLEKREQKLIDLVENTVPIGFVYTQLPDQPKPQSIWPLVEWSEISSEYAGLFTRVIGKNSGRFGETQQENAPRLVGVRHHCNRNNYTGQTLQLTANDEWSREEWHGDSAPDGKSIFVNYKISSGEVRPRNTAVRIWKRIK